MSEKVQKTILIVEDDCILAVMCQKTLARCGYKSILANTGEDAVDIFKQNLNTINLILMDIDLGGGMDGTEAAALILNNWHVPVVFLSSHTEPEIVEKTEKITSYGYVVKGSGITVLDASIKMAFKLFDAQQKMNERDERMQKAEIMAGFGNWELDLARNTFQASEGARLIYGLAENELSAKIVQNCPLPRYRAMLDSALRDLIEQKAPYDVVFEIRRPNDGNLAFIHSIARYDAARNCVTGIIHDITERKRAEEKIIQINDRYEKLSENCLAVFWEVDARGLYTYLNNASKTVYGLEPGDLCGRKYFYDLHPEKKREAYKKAAFEVFSRKEPFNDFENEIELPDGGIVWVSTSGIPVLDCEGNLSGYRGTDIDITARKLTEEALKNSELKYRSLIEHSSDVVFCVDQNGEYKFVNQVFASTFGKTPDYFCGKTFWDIYPKEHADHRQSVSLKVFDTGESQSAEVVVPLPDRTMYYLAKANPICDDTGKVVLNLTHAIDITGRKLAEEKIKTLLAEKELLLKEVHHRIKNNMNTVAGIMSMQLDTLSEPSAVGALEDARSREIGRAHV